MELSLKRASNKSLKKNATTYLTTTDSNLVHISHKVLKALEWKGIAMVEFKGNYLIEINPRFWGSMPLLFLTSSDLFGNYIKILQNQSTVIHPDQIKYQTDKIMFFFPQAILSILDLLKSKKFKGAILGLKVFVLGKEGIFRLKNLKPFFKYLLLLLKRIH